MALYENTEEKREGVRRTAVYCRVSTASDLQDGSYETQVRYYRQLVEDHPGLVLAGIYGDHGKSGWHMRNRPGFMEMLQDCEAGGIDLILTKSISRFARNMADCIGVIRRLTELNVMVHFEKEQFTTNRRSSELLLGILAAIAQEESLSLSQNVAWAKEKRNAMGQPAEPVSYGYRRLMPGYEWMVEIREARRVRLAFHMACSCCDYEQIRMALGRMEEQEQTGKVWNQAPLAYMLTNINYTGDYLTNKTCLIETEAGRREVRNTGIVSQYYIENHHAPLVNREVFGVTGELVRRRILYKRRVHFSEKDRLLIREARTLALREWGAALETGRRWEREG